MILLFLHFVEWTLYEQVAIAALDCQCLDVAKVTFSSSYIYLCVCVCVKKGIFSYKIFWLFFIIKI